MDLEKWKIKKMILNGKKYNEECEEIIIDEWVSSLASDAFINFVKIIVILFCGVFVRGLGCVKGSAAVLVKLSEKLDILKS